MAECGWLFICGSGPRAVQTGLNSCCVNMPLETLFVISLKSNLQVKRMTDDLNGAFFIDNIYLVLVDERLLKNKEISIHC